MTNKKVERQRFGGVRGDWRPRSSPNTRPLNTPTGDIMGLEY